VESQTCTVSKEETEKKKAGRGPTQPQGRSAEGVDDGPEHAIWISAIPFVWDNREGIEGGEAKR